MNDSPVSERPILLTVFEPFDGAPVNASREVGRRIAARDARIELLELPVARGTADALLIERLADRTRPVPRFVLALGEAGPRPRTVRLEKVAVNWDDYRIPDNAGNQPRDEPIRVDGPAAYFSTVPVSAVAKSLEKRLPLLKVVVSLTAGSFLCNRVSYAALDWLSTNPVCPFFFVHVPSWRPPPDVAADDQSAGSKRRANVSLPRLVDTVAAVLNVADSHVGACHVPRL